MAIVGEFNLVRDRKRKQEEEEEDERRKHLFLIDLIVNDERRDLSVLLTNESVRHRIASDDALHILLMLTNNSCHYLSPLILNGDRIVLLNRQ